MYGLSELDKSPIRAMLCVLTEEPPYLWLDTAFARMVS